MQDDELRRLVGQMIMVGFFGPEVTPEVRELITQYHVGSIILSSKNLKGAESTRKLIRDLQQIAHDSGYEEPLFIGIDQEQGMLDNICDEVYLTQFPGPMAVVATKSTDLAHDVAQASARELKALGINWVFGPVLDVLTNSTSRLLGVRTMGDDPQEVSRFGAAAAQGYVDGGVTVCGKHFPGYGNATVDSVLGLPIVPDSLEQLETSSLIPFRRLIAEGRLDIIMVGGCALPKIAMHEMHACLSDRVVREILREDMNFDGIILSECLEMDALYENVGVRQGSVMAAAAGCDMILVCSSYRLQKEALDGMTRAVKAGVLDVAAVSKSAFRVRRAKRRYLSWQQALNPIPLPQLREMHLKHQLISDEAYERSTTVLRDNARNIPLSKSIEIDSDILLLTPLCTPLISTRHDASTEQLLLGEAVFQPLGRALAKCHSGKVLHASYTANGLTAMHDGLIERSQAVIVATADATRNMYQLGLTKYVAMICNQQRKPLIIVAASTPYDLALDRSIGTYVCSYEFTEPALKTLAKVLFGQLPARGIFPGSGLYQGRSLMMGSSADPSILDPAAPALPQDVGAPAVSSTRSKWLVETWECDTADERELGRLKTLWENCFPQRRMGPGVEAFKMLCRDHSPMSVTQTHFVVRNSSTNNMYGFCATWVYEPLADTSAARVGCIALLFVDPSRRGMSIGKCLHDQAVRYLRQDRQCHYLQLGTAVPAFCPGIPSNSPAVLYWFKSLGWAVDAPGTPVADESAADEDESQAVVLRDGINNTAPATASRTTLILNAVQDWVPGKKLISELEMIGIRFDVCAAQGDRITEVLRLVDLQCDVGVRSLYELARNAADAKIVVALDPVQRSVVGALILFTRGRDVALAMPWIYEFTDARVGGLCGLVTHRRYRDLANLFTLGLVCCAVRQFKLQGFERVVLDGASSQLARLAEDTGFQTLKTSLRVTSAPLTN